MDKQKLMKNVIDFGIEFQLQLYHDQIIEMVRKFLNPVTCEMMKGMIANNEALPIPDAFFHFAKEYENFADHFPPERLFELIYEARQDLGEAIVECGEDGNAYIIKMREFIIASVTVIKAQEQPPQPPQQPPPISQEIPVDEILNLTCEECAHKWDIKSEEMVNVKECPNCGAPAGICPPGSPPEEPPLQEE